MRKATHIKDNISVAYSFRGSVHCHGRKHGSMQTDIVLEELRVLLLDMKPGTLGRA